jgi:hypothetical protein
VTRLSTEDTSIILALGQATHLEKVRGKGTGWALVQNNLTSFSDGEFVIYRRGVQAGYWGWVT